MAMAFDFLLYLHGVLILHASLQAHGWQQRALHAKQVSGC
jgi:hypothetical protein